MSSRHDLEPGPLPLGILTFNPWVCLHVEARELYQLRAFCIQLYEKHKSRLLRVQICFKREKKTSPETPPILFHILFFKEKQLLILKIGS